jgi:hypothetical protein
MKRAFIDNRIVEAGQMFWIADDRPFSTVVVPVPEDGAELASLKDAATAVPELPQAAILEQVKLRNLQGGIGGTLPAQHEEPAPAAKKPKK